MKNLIRSVRKNSFNIALDCLNNIYKNQNICRSRSYLMGSKNEGNLMIIYLFKQQTGSTNLATFESDAAEILSLQLKTKTFRFERT